MAAIHSRIAARAALTNGVASYGLVGKPWAARLAFLCARISPRVTKPSLFASMAAKFLQIRGVLPAQASDWLSALSLLTSALANFPLGAAEATAATNGNEVTSKSDLRTFKQTSDLCLCCYAGTGRKTCPINGSASPQLRRATGSRHDYDP